jgi:hypothetical protein
MPKGMGVSPGAVCGNVTRAVHAGHGTCRWSIGMKEGIIAVFALLCAAWLGYASLYVFALRRAGSGWSREARIWARVRVAEYVSLVVLIVAGLSGFPRVVLTMGVVWALLVLVRSMVRRRIRDWPPAWDKQA